MVSTSLERNSQHFNEAREQLEKWAEDMVVAVERELRDTKEQIVDIDFAANAASYGCHATKVSSIQELRTALENNKNISNSCVTVIDTDPSVSTPGTAWWEVAVAELSSETAVKASRKDYEAQLQYRKTLNK